MFSRKTQPKKNADWFCEKCKGQEGNNGEVGLEIDEKGLKPNAWQTPAQRKAYSGQPTVNPAKTKVRVLKLSVLISVVQEFNVKPPDGIGKKSAAKVGKDSVGKKKAELNHTPSRSGLRDFLGSEESTTKAGAGPSDPVEPGNLKRKTKQRKRDESPRKEVKKPRAMPAHVSTEETASDLQTTSNLLEAVSPENLTSSITSTASSMMPDVATRPKSVKDSTSPKPVPVAVPLSIAQAKSPLAGLSIKGQVQVRVRSPEGVPLKSRLANLPIAVVQSRSPENTGAPAKLAGLPITVALATSPRKMIVSSPSTTLPIMSTASKGIIPGSIGSPVKALDLTTVGQTKVLSVGPTTNPPRLATGSSGLPAVVRTILSPGMTRSPMVGAGLRAVRPRLPTGASRPSLVAVRTKQPSLRLVTKLPPGVRPNIPLSRPTLLVARPGLRPVRPMTKPNVSQAMPVTLANIVRSPPTSTKPVSVPMLNKAASDEDIVMLADTDTESFEDLPNNMIKLIKVNEDKDSSSKEKTEDERMDDESFMDMFDDETRKLAETFDMFEPTGSSKNGDDNESTKKTMEDGKSSEEQSPTEQSAHTAEGRCEQNETPQAPDTPGTPGTPRLMICTPGASPPFGASASGSPPTPTGQGGGIRLRGMRPRGGQVVTIRGGSALRLRMPLRVPIRGGVASLVARPRGLVASRMRSSGPMTGRPALLRPTTQGRGTPRAMLTRPSAPRPVLVRPQPLPTTTASGSVQGTSETTTETTDILMTKDTTPAHLKKEAAEVIDLGEETTPPAPKRKATMDKLTHLGISVSRKKGEQGSTSHSSLPQAVAQSPSVTKPAAATASSKKVTVELSESQIKALKALGMM